MCSRSDEPPTPRGWGLWLKPLMQTELTSVTRQDASPVFRADQLRQFQTLSAALRRLSDDQLRQVRLELGSLLREEKTTPVRQVLCAFADVAVDEVNHRLAEDWNSDARLQGGHKVYVASDLSVFDTFQGVCAPLWDGTECWIGPVRSTYEEAAEDGRRHHPDAA